MARASRTRRLSQMAEQPAAPSPEELEERRLAKLTSLGTVLGEHRKEAVEGRRASGIETIWREDEEHYEGIDDKNRHTFTGDSKPPGSSRPKVGPEESIEFPNITAAYVDAAAARVGDILVPTDERAWSMKETPVPELMEKAKGLSIEVIKGLASMNADEETSVKVAQAEMQAAEAMMAAAVEKAKKAEKRIEDWHIEGQFQAQLREIIDDAAKMGTGVLKGPIPEKKKLQMYKDGKLQIQELTKPVSKRIDAWNCYPDPACGRSIHNGRYFFERDFFTPKQLMDLRGQQGYIESQINLCLNEGPSKKGKEEVRVTADGRILDDEKLFEVWYFHGYATREDLEAAGWTSKKTDLPVQIPVVFTMVNDRVIKGTMSHLDTGEFPYDFMPWERRKNSPWGKSVGRKARTAQRIITASTRVMLTNAGRAAGPLVVMKNHVKGANGSNDVAPWKVYYAGATDTTDDVRKAFTLIEIPALTDKLMVIIQFGMKLAEDATGLPMLLQGQVGSAPDTFGGQQLADRNATGVLRRIARQFDDCITEPHIRRYYTYLLMWGDDDYEKGEFVVDARGSTALVERQLAREKTAQLLQASLNPQFGLDPKRVMAEDLRADNRNPKDYQFTEKELEEQAQAQQQQGGDPRAESAKEVATIRSQADVQKATLNQQADMAELRFKAQEAEKMRRHEEKLAVMARDLKIMEISQATQVSISDIKAQLAGKAMTLKMQKDLSDSKGPQVATPAVEPAGRAPADQAFAK